MPVEGRLELPNSAFPRTAAQRIANRNNDEQGCASDGKDQAEHTIGCGIDAVVVIPDSDGNANAAHDEERQETLSPRRSHLDKKPRIAFFIITTHVLFLPIRAQEAHFEPHHHCIAMQTNGTGSDTSTTLIACPCETRHGCRDGAGKSFAVQNVNRDWFC